MDKYNFEAPLNAAWLSCEFALQYENRMAGLRMEC